MLSQLVWSAMAAVGRKAAHTAGASRATGQCGAKGRASPVPCSGPEAKGLPGQGRASCRSLSAAGGAARQPLSSSHLLGLWLQNKQGARRRRRKGAAFKGRPAVGLAGRLVCVDKLTRGLVQWAGGWLSGVPKSAVSVLCIFPSTCSEGGGAGALGRGHGGRVWPGRRSQRLRKGRPG